MYTKHASSQVGALPTVVYVFVYVHTGICIHGRVSPDGELAETYTAAIVSGGSGEEQSTGEEGSLCEGGMACGPDAGGLSRHPER